MQRIKLPQSKFRTFFSSGIGNTIEIFDFTLYGVFIPIMGSLFFPENDPAVVFLQAVTLYGAGFLMRPLGGIFFGHLGDKKGRRIALSTSILMMTFATGLIGFLPSYETIGITSTCLLVFCRLLQGFSVGGEYIGASIFLVEHTKTQKGFASAIVASAGAVGSLLGAGMGALLLNYFAFEGAWRIPFLLSMVLGSIGFYVRFFLNETPSFINRTTTEKVPLFTVLRQFPVKFGLVFVLGATQVTLAYAIFVYQGIYFTQYLLLPSSEALTLGCVGIVTYIVCVPLFGWKSDTYGYARVMKYSLIYTALTLYPIYSLFHLNEFTSIFLGQILFSIGVAGYCAPASAFMAQLLPTSVRYTGVGFGYSLGGILGGLMPSINALLIDYTGSIWMPMYYELICVAITIAVLHMSTSSKTISPKKEYQIGGLQHEH